MKKDELKRNSITLICLLLAMAAALVLASCSSSGGDDGNDGNNASGSVSGATIYGGGTVGGIVTTQDTYYTASSASLSARSSGSEWVDVNGSSVTIYRGGSSESYSYDSSTGLLSSGYYLLAAKGDSDTAYLCGKCGGSLTESGNKLSGTITYSKDSFVFSSDGTYVLTKNSDTYSGTYTYSQGLYICKDAVCNDGTRRGIVKDRTCYAVHKTYSYYSHSQP